MTLVLIGPFQRLSNILHDLMSSDIDCIERAYLVAAVASDASAFGECYMPVLDPQSLSRADADAAGAGPALPCIE